MGGRRLVLENGDTTMQIADVEAGQFLLAPGRGSINLSGDSGGPALVSVGGRHHVVGVVSGGPEGCEDFTVYATVSKALPGFWAIVVVGHRAQVSHHMVLRITLIRGSAHTETTVSVMSQHTVLMALIPPIALVIRQCSSGGSSAASLDPTLVQQAIVRHGQILVVMPMTMSVMSRHTVLLA